MRDTNFRLQQLLLLKFGSQTRAARSIGLSPGGLSQIVHGKPPTPAQRVKLAAALGSDRVKFFLERGTE